MVPYEGAILERLEFGCYRLHLQGYRSDLDRVREYQTIESTVRDYMQCEWPRANIDGCSSRTCDINSPLRRTHSYQPVF